MPILIEFNFNCSQHFFCFRLIDASSSNEAVHLQQRLKSLSTELVTLRNRLHVGQTATSSGTVAGATASNCGSGVAAGTTNSATVTSPNSNLVNGSNNSINNTSKVSPEYEMIAFQLSYLIMKYVTVWITQLTAGFIVSAHASSTRHCAEPERS